MFALVATGAGLTGHVHAGLTALVVVAVVLVPAIAAWAWLLAHQPRSAASLMATLLIAQAFVHVVALLVASMAERPHHVDHGEGTVGSVAASSAGWSMLLLHVVAAVIAGLVLARWDQLAWRALRACSARVVAASTRLLHALTRPRDHVASTLVTAVRPRFIVHRTGLASAAAERGRRGPPRPLAAR